VIDPHTCKVVQTERRDLGFLQQAPSTTDVKKGMFALFLPRENGESARELHKLKAKVRVETDGCPIRREIVILIEISDGHNAWSFLAVSPTR